MNRPCAPRLLTWLARHRLLLLVGALALAVRLAWNLWIHPPARYVFSDMAGYIARADRLLDGPLTRRADEPFFPYGAHYLLAAVKALFGRDNHTAIAVYQALTGALVAVLACALSLRLTRGPRRRPPALLAGNARAGAWVPALAGVLVALYYPLISFGGYYLSELPFAACVTASALLTLRLADEARPRDAWLLGLALGIGAATRPQILATVPLVAAFWLLRRRELGPLRPGLLLRAAIPLCVVLAFSAARLHYHTGRAGLISQNGAVNRVFGRCHNTRTESIGGGWFAPPALGALHRYETRHPGAWVKLDPAMGILIKTTGTMWDEAKLHAIADRCVATTGWLRQARYGVTHVVLLWGYNNTWPDSSGKEWGPLMRGFRNAHMIVLLPPLAAAMLLAPRRKDARRGLLAMSIWALVAVAVLYFGDTRYRVPYDAVILVLALDVYARVARRAWGALARIPPLVAREV